jgi:uncharacterized protein YjeT (DUF2065 family)
MFAFGASQLLRPQKWTDYIPDVLAEALPVSPETSLRVHGTINITLGLLLLRKPSKPIAGLAALWWLGVLPLCAEKEGWQTGLRDLSIASSLLAVAVARPLDNPSDNHVDDEFQLD